MAKTGNPAFQAIGSWAQVPWLRYLGLGTLATRPKRAILLFRLLATGLRYLGPICTSSPQSALFTMYVFVRSALASVGLLHDSSACLLYLVGSAEKAGHAP